MRSRQATTPRTRPAGRLVRGVVALALGAGSAGLTALVLAGQPAAAAPAPTLIVSNYTANNLLRFPLSATGNVAPTVTTSSSGGSLTEVSASVLDGAGNLWVTTNASIEKFTPGQLTASGSPTPAVVLQSTAFPSGLAFDSAGDLWVSGYDGGIFEYTPGQLAASGQPHAGGGPDGQRSGRALGAPRSTARATSGWAGTAQGTSWSSRRAELAMSGSPTPAVTISGLGLEVITPAFDANGDLWVSTYDSKSLDELTPSQLAASGSPTPAVSITSPSVDEPDGLAFDTAGDLWATDYTGAAVYEFSPSQLAAVGQPDAGQHHHGGEHHPRRRNRRDHRPGAGGDLPHPGERHRGGDRHDQGRGLPLGLDRPTSARSRPPPSPTSRPTSWRPPCPTAPARWT